MRKTKLSAFPRILTVFIRDLDRFDFIGCAKILDILKCNPAGALPQDMRCHLDEGPSLPIWPMRPASRTTCC